MGHKIKHKKKIKEDATIEQPVEEIVEDYNDQFVEIANEALDKAISYKYWILGSMIVVVTIVAAYSFYKANLKSNMLSVSNSFSEASSSMDAEVVANSEATGQFKTEEEKLNNVIEKFELFKKNNPGAQLVTLADLNIANSYYKLSKYNEALVAYDKFIAKTKDNTLKELASLRKGVILKELKKYDDAIVILTTLNSSKNSYIAPASLFQVGEIYSLKKDDVKAKTFYNRLVKEYSNSLFGQKAKSKL